MIKKKPQKSREEINEQSKLLKRKKKHKGLPSGSRINNTETSSNKNSKMVTDSRIGSKKPIPLIVQPGQTTKIKKQNTVQPKTKILPPEQELARLENDPYLEQLLDLVEDGESLTAKQQQDLDKMLDRIDTLMEQLGYTDLAEDADDGYQPKEDIVSLLKKH